MCQRARLLAGPVSVVRMLDLDLALLTPKTNIISPSEQHSRWSQKKLLTEQRADFELLAPQNRFYAFLEKVILKKTLQRPSTFLLLEEASLFPFLRHSLHDIRICLYALILWLMLSPRSGRLVLPSLSQGPVPVSSVWTLQALCEALRWKTGWESSPCSSLYLLPSVQDFLRVQGQFKALSKTIKIVERL